MRFSFLDETETKYIRKMFTWKMGTICTKYGVNFNLVRVSYNLCDRMVKTDFWYQFLKIKLIKKMQRDISVYHTAFLPEENYRLSQLFSGFAISRALLYAISRVIHV